MIPYIGLSKSSCAFCDVFFAAYREHKGEVYTHVTDGRTAAWKYPALAENTEIKTTFCLKVGEHIKAGLVEERRKASRAPGESFCARFASQPRSKSRRLA